MKKIFLVTFALLNWGLSFSQNSSSWTLQQCIDYAMKNNIQVKQSELNVKLSKENLLQSEANVLPSLNGNVSHSYNVGRRIDPFTNQFADNTVLSQNFSLSSSITLFRGLQNYNTIKQNQYNFISSKYDVDKLRNDISLSIATNYLQILFNEELLQIAQNQVLISQKQVDRTSKLVEVGTLAKGSLLDIQAQLASEEMSLATAQNQLDLSYLSLVQLLDLDSVQNFKIVKPNIDIPSESVLAATPEQIYGMAKTSQPNIKSQEYKLKSAEKGVSIAYGGISPTISLSGSYGTGYSGASKRIKDGYNPTLQGYYPNGDTTSAGDYVFSPLFSSPEYEDTPFKDQINNNINKFVGLNISIPLFNNLQTKSSISRAKIQKLNAEYSLQLSQNELRKTIQQAHADALAALKKYNATQKSVAAIQESFKYTEQKYTVGMVNSLEYNDSKNKLAKAQSDLLQAKYDYVFKVKVLDFYMGKPLMF